MTTRGMTFGTYNTATELWTLTAWALGAAVPQENLVEVPGRQAGPLDLTAALTDGEPVFTSRTLTATFECSAGTRADRTARLAELVNRLAGRRLQIILPDDPDRYMVGRLTVTELYNDAAHCSVQVDAICEPWKYAAEETVVELTAASGEQTQLLPNTGRMKVCPSIEVKNTAVLRFGELETDALGPGIYTLPDLQIPQDGLELTYSGSGAIILKYREAVL